MYHSQSVSIDRKYEMTPLPFIESWSMQCPSCSHIQCASLFSIHEQEYPWHVQIMPSVFIVPMPKRECSLVLWWKIVPNGSPFTSPSDRKIRQSHIVLLHKQKICIFHNFITILLNYLWEGSLVDIKFLNGAFQDCRNVRLDMFWGPCCKYYRTGPMFYKHIWSYHMISG